jgi:hypothetical protein
MIRTSDMTSASIMVITFINGDSEQKNNNYHK